MNNNTILVTGAQGQLGRTLEYYWAASDLAKENELVFYDIGELDLTLTNIETNEKIWLGQKKIKKIIERKRISF